MTEPRNIIPIRPGVSLDKRVERDYKPTEQVFALLTRALVNGPDDDPGQLRSVLAAVYKEMSLTDNDLARRLASLETQGVITNDERLHLFVLLTVDRSLGTFGLAGVRDAIVHGSFCAGSIDIQLQQIDGLDPAIREKVLSCLRGIQAAPVEVIADVEEDTPQE